jgi:hypothetical protein
MQNLIVAETPCDELWWFVAKKERTAFTRLTNAFSKKCENHELMFALFVGWYNFCRTHMTLRTTPAVAAGIASEAWTVERLLAESAKSAA